MEAFVEILSGVVRVGPECRGYGDPFDLAVAFSVVDGESAVIKALVSNGSLSQSHARAIIRAIESVGLTANWERINAAGDIYMHKSHTQVRSPENAVKDGIVDLSIVETDAAHATEQFKSGKEKMLSVHRIVFPDGSVMDCFHHIAA